MGSEDITQDELLAEVAAFVLASRTGRPEGEGWYSTNELLEQALLTDTSMTNDKMHDLLSKLAAERKMEKQKSGKVLYWRKL